MGPEQRPCEFGHSSGAIVGELGGIRAVASARVIIGPDETVTALDLSGLNVQHKGISYRVTAILPRYRPGGRLHHVSLELDRIA